MPPELSPPGFSAVRAKTVADQLVKSYGARESGSTQDNQVAALVEARLEGFGFTASALKFSATTLSGRKELTGVVGMRPGPSDRRLLVVASRDGSEGELRRAGALETGVLLELARVLEGRSFEHSIVLASVSGGVDGGVGAERLIRQLRGPFDGVLVVRNISDRLAKAPVLVASNTRSVADESYVRTVRRIAGLEFARSGEDQRRSVPAQLVRLGFPLALGEQASLPGLGVSGVSLSPGGEPLHAAGKVSAGTVTDVGQIALRTLTTLDTGPAPAAPKTAPIRVGGLLIPQWAFVLLIGTLYFPLLVGCVDAWARARRWRQPAQRGLLAPAIALGWLLVIGFLLRGLGLTGMIDAPALAPDPSAVKGVGATLIGLLALLLGLLGVMVGAAAARQATPKGGEAGFALWVVFTGVAVFVLNPVAAGFLLLLMHLVVLMLLTSGAPRRRQVAGLTLVGLLPIALAALYFPVVFGIAAPDVLRYAVLLVAGGFTSPLALAIGCAVVAAAGTALIHLWWSAPRETAERRRRVTQSF